VLFAVTFAAAQSCQQSQVRITKERAIAAAQASAGFAPDRTQVRLVRQGLNGRPYWAVSLSTSSGPGAEPDRITTVRVDANTGVVAAVNPQTP
jgi:uncharacterized membrane protein YkoI